jgi:hypothetical protein
MTDHILTGIHGPSDILCDISDGDGAGFEYVVLILRSTIVGFDKRSQVD